MRSMPLMDPSKNLRMQKRIAVFAQRQGKCHGRTIQLCRRERNAQRMADIRSMAAQKRTAGGGAGCSGCEPAGDTGSRGSVRLRRQGLVAAAEAARRAVHIGFVANDDG